MKLALRSAFSSFGRTALTALALFFIITGVSYAYASWTEPSGTPPSGNVPPPLNTGSTAQTKTGDLTVNNLTSMGNLIAASFSMPTGAVAGYVLTADANGNATWQPAASSTGYSPGSKVYSTPGNYTFTVPSNIHMVNIELWGGGGGAGSNTISSNYAGINNGNHTNDLTGGGGGGSGGYFIMEHISVTPGTSIPITVGAGGAGGIPQANTSGDWFSDNAGQTYGAPGGASTFGGSSQFSTVYTATGGNGGVNFDSTSSGGGQCNGVQFCSGSIIGTGGTPSGNNGAGCTSTPNGPNFACYPSAGAPLVGTAGGAAVPGLGSEPGYAGAGAGGGGTSGWNPGTPGSPGAVVIWW